MSLIPPFVPPWGPATNITPFTYRDGLSYLQRLERLRRYMDRVLIPWVNENYDGLAEAFTNSVNLLIEQINEAIDMVINDSIELQDPVMAAIFQNEDSATRAVTDDLYASRVDLEALETLVNSGRLSQAQLDARYVNETDFTAAIDAITTQINNLEITVSDNYTELLGQIADINAILNGRLSEDSVEQIAYDAALDASFAEAHLHATNSAWPVFNRANGGAPVLVLNAQNVAPGAIAPTNATGFYWAGVIRVVESLGESRLDDYYLYCSSDHASGGTSDGVWLFTAPSPVGPWLGRGRVFDDNSGGSGTETPCVVVDPTGQYKFLMYYQQGAVPGAVGGQTTKWAYSNNGTSWTVGGIAADIPVYWPSDGHTGYFNAKTWGGNLVAHHLAGGGNWLTMFDISYSYDGRTWALDPVPLSWQADMTDAVDRRIEWNHGGPVIWNNARYWIGIMTKLVSGVTPKDARLIIAPISADLKALTGKPKTILYPPVGDESVDYRSVNVFQDIDGHLYIYINTNSRVFVATTKAGV